MARARRYGDGAMRQTSHLACTAAVLTMTVAVSATDGVLASVTLRYDTNFNGYSKAECVQLNLAHVARKKYKKKLKQTNLVQYRFTIREGIPEGIRVTDYGGKD